MAVEIPGFGVGICEAAADLSAKQFMCVKVTADFKINISTVAGESVLGVLQDKPVAGQPGNVMGIGVTKLKAGVGGLAANATWMSAADGTGIACTAAKVGMGKVLKAASEGELAVVTIGFATGATIPA